MWTLTTCCNTPGGVALQGTSGAWLAADTEMTAS
jgi:hypothetical protein